MKKVQNCLLIPTDMTERQAMLKWVKDRLDVQFPVRLAFPLGVIHNDKLICVFVYHDHQQPAIMLTVCADSPHWARPKVLQALLGWPFTVLKVGRITAMIEKGNKRSLRITGGDAQRGSKGAGFKREGTLRKASKNGKDIVMFGMLRSEYEARYGKLETQPKLKLVA